jgi:hypothetical protein
MARRPEPLAALILQACFQWWLITDWFEGHRLNGLAAFHRDCGAARLLGPINFPAAAPVQGPAAPRGPRQRLAGRRPPPRGARPWSGP